MLIEIKVNTNANNNSIIFENNIYKANLTTKPVDGKANAALIKMLADYFDVSKSQISIIKGEKNRNKLVKFELGSMNNELGKKP